MGGIGNFWRKDCGEKDCWTEDGTVEEGNGFDVHVDDDNGAEA